MIMNWLRNLMAGRYGVDHLSLFLLAVGLVFSILSGIQNWAWAAWVCLVLLVICYLRMFSRNISKRYQENQKFLGLFRPIQNAYRRLVQRKKDSKYYRFYRCPNCKTRLRVPKGKGKICITCPNCKKEFVKTT